MTPLAFLTAFALAASPVMTPARSVPAAKVDERLEDDANIQFLRAREKAAKHLTEEAKQLSDTGIALAKWLNTPLFKPVSRRMLLVHAYALLAWSSAVDDVVRAEKEWWDRKFAKQDLSIKLADQHFAMIRGYSTARGVYCIIAHRVEPMTERCFGRSLPRFPDLPPLPSKLIKP
jgi:hypothetical protein